MTLDINNQVRDAIVAHAKECAPKESCGLIMADKYVPCPNEWPDPEGGFVIAPDTMASAHQSGQLRAVVHSHPVGPYGPTKLDMQQQAEGDVPWGIVALHPQNRPDLFFWGDSLPIAPYEGRQFRHGIADCYALVRDWYRQEHGVVMPMTPRDAEWWNDGQSVIEDHLHEFDFETIGPEQPMRVGDVPLFKIGCSTVNHSGIYVGNGLVLHHLTGRLSRKDVLGPWQQKYLIKTMRPKFAINCKAGA